MEINAVVVDDDPHVLSLAARWLRRAGCDAVMSSTFEDAQTQILVFEPSILIADVRLGDFNGIQLGLLAQRIRRDVRILIISGWDDCVLRREAERLGAAFLPKPFTSTALLSAVGLSNGGPEPSTLLGRCH
jgi:DNA-binding response OmpR family regulator